MANDADWVSRYRQANTAWISAMNALLALKAQYVSLDYGNTLPPEAFEGANADISLPDIVAAVGSVDSINTFFLTGHNSNMYRIIL